jgi:ElaB/YqjD/DUF883 family membrane-anchored ribosome-binding protein
MFNHNHDTVNERAERIADDATKSFEELGREVNHHAEHAKSDMVKTLYDAAKTLRKQAREAGAHRDVVDHVDNVAEGFEKAASYLKHNSYGDIGEAAVHKAKSNPMQTMAIILVIGVIIGLLLRGSSHDHA